MKYQRGQIPANAFEKGDLTAADKDAMQFDWAHLLAYRVRDENDPTFEAGYRFLHDEFHPVGEIESPEVLAARLRWDPTRQEKGLALLYEMLVVTAAQGVVAVRDHTAIVDCTEADAPVVVHLSHVLISPAWRGTGLGAWLRTLPIETGRACMQAAGKPLDHPIVLACEMEHPIPDHPTRTKRLGAYERAGFLKVNPSRVPYHQPDFRAPERIDRDGGPMPLPMALIVRRVEREQEREISGAEARSIVSLIYSMFSLGFRETDMRPLWQQLEEQYPGVDEQVSLIPPTQA